ncbi:TMV resistance protein N-like protein [Tanacetum coccineum]
MSPSPRIRQRRKYDVFLSFRGTDTRNNFVSHLYAQLDRNSIDTFLDDEGLLRGSDIGPTLLQTIEESRIAIVVFSKNYPDSSWCLNELLKIMQCHNDKENRLIVYPVFYDVSPSDVRNQTGLFGEAFSQQNDHEKIDLWREALKQSGYLAGWDLNDPAGS